MNSRAYLKTGFFVVAALLLVSQPVWAEKRVALVIGNSTWASNSFIDFNGNSDLAMNSMNWLSSDEDLISIRPKPPEDRQLTMTANQMRWVRISSQFLLPLVVVLAGVGVWWRRR